MDSRIRYIRDVPDDTWRRLKIASAAAGRPLQETVVAALNWWLDEMELQGALPPEAMRGDRPAQPIKVGGERNG
ncbi:MAG: hypothetical protein ABIJ57_00535 [Pseudomonadota bacterium]